MNFFPFQTISDEEARVAVFFSRWPDHPVERGDGRAKLTRDQVRAIKSAEPKFSHGELSRQYGVGVPLISMIRNGRIWKSVALADQE